MILPKQFYIHRYSFSILIFIGGGIATDTDKKLAERMKKNDETAFAEIIHRFTPLVATIIRNIAGGQLNHADVEEVTTDVFVTLWKNSEKLDTNMLKPYIVCIAKSRAKDRLRREQHNEMILIL